jgi:CBS domain containing-hemolysin-like protein
MARHIVRHLNNYLSATQLGITMASLGLGWLGEPVFASLLRPLLTAVGIHSQVWVDSLSFAFGFTTRTFLHITAGELAPKWLTIQKPLSVAVHSAGPLHWFYIAFYPFNRLLNFAARWLLTRIGIEPDGQAEGGHSQDELRLVIASAQTSRGGDNLVLNAFDLRQRVVREVMRPRNEISAFNSCAPVAECLQQAERSRYSRFPICEDGNLDRILGVIHIKDLYAWQKKATLARDLLPVARKLIYVPETACLELLLKRFLDRKLHFAAVVDEYGGTLGIVTLENILEELVGQIQDEFDQEKPELVIVTENIWEAAGTMALHDLEKITGPVAHDETTATVSGWLTHRLGGFPKEGDTLAVGTCDLLVEEMDGPRVARLKITRRETKVQDHEKSP